MTSPARTDGNQREIVEALRKAGASVHCCHEAGGGFPDLCVGYQGRTYLMECKVPGARLNALQRKWHELWRGQAAIVRSSDDALRVIGVIE